MLGDDDTSLLLGRGLAHVITAHWNHVTANCETPNLNLNLNPIIQDRVLPANRDKTFKVRSSRPK